MFWTKAQTDIQTDRHTYRQTYKQPQRNNAYNHTSLGGRICLKYMYIQRESKKCPPEDLWQFFQNAWEFFNQILRAYYAFLSTLDYKFLFNYLQL